MQGLTGCWVRVSGIASTRGFVWYLGPTRVSHLDRGGAPEPGSTATHSRGTPVSTYTPKADEIERAWHVVDADGLVLGRLASEVASVLRGKHKPTFTPHIDTGDHVVIVNAAKVVLTGAKESSKNVYDHSGYPGGLRTRTYGKFLADKPEEALRRTIRGMLPRNRLGRQMLKKLKVYSGAEHPHEAQQPQSLALEHTRARTA